MITPQFEVRQDDAFVYIDIRAPYIKASHIQFEVSDNVFVFSLPPYYLRLRFPGKVIEDEHMTSSYDLSKALVHCKVSKMNRGEKFEDSDMLSKSLATKRQENMTKNKPLIEELDGQTDDISEAVGEPDFDWEVEQKVPARLDITDDEKNMEGSVHYGFNNQYTERIGLSIYAGNEINESDDPEKDSDIKKHDLIKTITKVQFDPDHYLADLQDDEAITDIMKFTFPNELSLNGSQKDRVMNSGHRQFSIENQKPIYIGVIPLVFAWAYDFRTNFGDSSIESSWTIGKLCPSMCFLYNSYTTVKEVVEDCTMRALSKPLYRHWQLTMTIWNDTLNIVSKGKSAISSVFAYLSEIFENELHAVYRQILIEDYAIWIQYASERALAGMRNELEKAIQGLSKGQVYLPISNTEQISESIAVGGDATDAPDSDDESESNS